MIYQRNQSRISIEYNRIFSFWYSRLNEVDANQNQDTSDEDSEGSIKTGEQATTD